jgi:hypothetical protein
LFYEGEHHARKVSFAETGIWKERFGEGRFELLHQRNGDVAPYPINMTIENDVPYWYVTASDTAVAGVGKCELRYIVNDVVIKSCTFITDVDASLGEGTEAPEPYKAWVDEVLEIGNKVITSVDGLEDDVRIASECATSASEDAESADASCQAARFHAESAESYAKNAELSEQTISAMLGDMHTALDSIIAMQNGLIGGDAV